VEPLDVKCSKKKTPTRRLFGRPPRRSTSSHRPTLLLRRRCIISEREGIRERGKKTIELSFVSTQPIPFIPTHAHESWPIFGSITHKPAPLTQPVCFSLSPIAMTEYMLLAPLFSCGFLVFLCCLHPPYGSKKMIKFCKNFYSFLCIFRSILAYCMSRLIKKYWRIIFILVYCFFFNFLLKIFVKNL
jgi:hypothetical protein